jgi:membrane-associated phospholipid phosphatase
MKFDARWVLPAAGFVAIQLAGALLMSAYLSYDKIPPFYFYGKLFLSVLSAGGVLLVACAFIHALYCRSPTPLRFIIGWLRGYLPRIPEFLCGFFLCWLQLTCLTWYKSMIPLTGPMRADVMLANWDKALFGLDPGPALQQPLKNFSSLIDRMYAFWAFTVKLVLVCLLAEARSYDRARLLLAFFLTVGLLGSWGQYLLLSGGPIYWHDLGLGDRFTSIKLLPAVKVGKEYLWAVYVGHDSGIASGISAMPSIHVATTTWMMLVAIKLFRGARLPIAFIFVVIAVGAVYTGWHYAVDAIAGVVGAIACFFLATLIVDRFQAMAASAKGSNPHRRRL